MDKPAQQPSSRPVRSALVMACLAAALSSVTPALQANEGMAQPTDWSVRGQTLFKVWGFEIYLATLRAPANFTPGQYASTPFALTLEYRRSFTGFDIARRSIEEMQKQASLSEEQAKRWGLQLQQLFPNVAKGDRITGRYWPEKGAEFTLNDQALGRIDDPELAKRFFAIWLSPRTSEPDMREALIGSREGGQ